MFKKIKILWLSSILKVQRFITYMDVYSFQVSDTIFSIAFPIKFIYPVGKW